MSSQAPTAGGADEAGRPVAGARTALRAAGSVIAPATLIAALLYWFGESRVRSQSENLGVDHSVFGFSNQDYVTRSVSSMFRPIVVALVVGLVWLLADWVLSSWVRSPADDHTRQRRRRIVAALVAVLSVAGLAIFLAGYVPLSETSARTVWQYPVRMGLGIALMGYAADVWWRFVARREPRPPGAISTTWVGPACGAVVAGLVVLCMFWAVSNYAEEVGTRLVVDLARGGLDDRPSVVVYSERDLRLSGSGVKESGPEGEPGGYRFRYEGLKLLLFSAGKFFLLPESWPGEGDARDPLIVLPDDNSVRLEFFR